MKKISFLFGLFGGLLCAQQFETVPVIETGSRDKRINLVIMGDGYTASQQGTFTQDVANIANYLFSKAPYSNYKNYFNVYAVKVISAETGIKHPGTAIDVTEPIIPVKNPNNYLGTSYDVGGTHRCVYSNTTNKVGQVLAANFPDYDMTLIVGNDTEYGGCGGTYAFLSRHSSAPDVAVHELGHSFGKLADEYWFAGSGESANKTKTSNPATIKWKNWVGSNNVGIYPYTESPTWFRPHQSCEMRYLNQQFCSVCKEALIEKIHGIQNPVDSYTPSNTTAINANNSMTFNVNLILPIPNTLVNNWMLNGVNVGTASNLTINNNQLNVGNNQLSFTVLDNTSDVRVDNHSTSHLTTVIWTINKTNLGVSNIGSTMFDFVVYPNPTEDYIQVSAKQKNIGDLRAVIMDMSGKIISTQDLKENNNYKVDLKRLPAQMYNVVFYKDNAMLFTKKIIKD